MLAPTVRSFFETIYQPVKLMLASDSCRSQYARNIRRLNETLGREALLTDFSDDLVSTVARSVVAAGASPATGNKVRSQLCALWTFAAKRGLVPTFPCVPKLREFTRVPTAWNQEQLARLWRACQAERGRVGDIPASLWWVNLHGVLWDCGCRIGTLVAILKGQERIRGLEWSYVDIGGASMRIVAENQKQKSDQAFRLHPDTAAALRAMQPRHKRYVFPWPHCEATLYARYGRILERAELPCGPRDKFHRMRRSVASWYKAAGGDATELLGHSDPRVTKCYLDPLICGTKQAADVLFRPAG